MHPVCGHKVGEPYIAACVKYWSLGTIYQTETGCENTNMVPMEGLAFGVFTMPCDILSCFCGPNWKCYKSTCGRENSYNWDRDIGFVTHVRTVVGGR